MSRSGRKPSRRELRGPGSALLAIAAFAVVLVGGLVAVELLTSVQGNQSGRPGGASRGPVSTDGPGAPPAASPSDGPDLYFATTAVDFGVVPLNTEVGYSFEYVNLGDEALRIEDVKVRAVEGC